MANPVVNSVVCACTFGMIPSVLTVSSQQKTVVGGMPAATIMDNKCLPFGMCASLANPAVASATAAALGVLTPMPCTPVIVGPWIPGSPTVLVENKPMLNNTSKLMCAYGGVIQVTMTPAVTTTIP